MAAALGVDELAAKHGGAAPHIGDHAAVMHVNIVIVGCGGDHHTDTDVGIVGTGVDHIGALGNTAAGNHVLALHGQIVGRIGLSISLDLRIGESLCAVRNILHSAGGLAGCRNRGIPGSTGALAMEFGLDQVNLDVSHGKRIGGRLRVGEVSEGCTHDGDRQQGDAEAQCGDFLFHVVVAPFMYHFCDRAQVDTH